MSTPPTPTDLIRMWEYSDGRIARNSSTSLSRAPDWAEARWRLLRDAALHECGDTLAALRQHADILRAYVDPETTAPYPVNVAKDLIRQLEALREYMVP